MTADRWERMKELFQAALERPAAAARAAFLAEACGDDAALRGEVESLLASHERAASFIEDPALDARALQAAPWNAVTVTDPTCERPGGDVGAEFPPAESLATPETTGKLCIPRQLGPVRLVREIGRGGMGVVYLGRDRMLDRDVAVKVLSNVVSNPSDPGFARFLQGARAAATVRHPGLTTVYHADLVGSIPYLELEYVDGPTIAELLDRCGAFDAEVAVDILIAVSAAVGALHDHGIVHCDIKPSNVLLNADGNLFVTDFGLTCARRWPADRPLTEVAGTPAYMAPEMFAGTISPRSDVYALGVMAFELLTATLPFTGTLDELREKHTQQPLPREPLEQRQVPARLIEVLERATHKNAAFRYKTARSFERAVKVAFGDTEATTSITARLGSLAVRCRRDPAKENPHERPSSVATSYYERLATMVAAKQAGTSSAVRPAPGSRVGADSPSRIDRASPPASAGVRPPDHAQSTRNARDILVLLRCPCCEYNLEGLPRRHRCPECGFEYDEFMYFLYGWSWQGAGWYRLTIFFAFLFTLDHFLADALFRRRWTLIPEALLFGVLLLAWRLKVMRQRVRIFFSAAGASQGPLRQAPRAIPWKEFVVFRLRHSRRGKWRLTLRPGVLRRFLGRSYIDAVVTCNAREAALLRGEIRRRLQAARCAARSSRETERC